MAIKKTIRIPKTDLPSKNNITNIEQIDLGGKNDIIARARYFSQEAMLNAPANSIIDTSATVSSIVGPSSYNGAYYVVISDLTFTTGLKIGTSLSATPGTSTFTGGEIFEIINSTSIKVWIGPDPVTIGTITDVVAEGAFISVVKTKNPHIFSVGDDVWIDQVTQYFDGSVQVGRVVDKYIYYYNQSLEGEYSTVGQAKSLLSETITSRGYIRKKVSGDALLSTPFSLLSDIELSSGVFNITIKSGVVTVTTIYNHKFLVGDSIYFKSYLPPELSLYLKNSPSERYSADYAVTSIYTITKIVSSTSFEFLISDTSSPTKNFTLISSVGTVGSVTGPDPGNGFYTAIITGMDANSTSKIGTSGYLAYSANNGTGSLGSGLISTQGTVGEKYTHTDGKIVRNITGMSSTKGLKGWDPLVGGGSVIGAISSTGNIYNNSYVHSVINSTSIRIYEDLNDYGYSWLKVNKAGAIKNIFAYAYLNGPFFAEVLSSNSMSIISTQLLEPGTITNLSYEITVGLTGDNIYQDVVRYTTGKPHGLSIGSNVSVYDVKPAIYNLSNYKLYYEPKDKSFDVHNYGTTTARFKELITGYYQNYVTFPPFGQDAYSADIKAKPYKSSGFINNLLYFLRYRLVSSDKNKFSAWTPIIKTEHNYYDNVESQDIDGGDQDW
jgi:hypothetical protein